MRKDKCVTPLGKLLRYYRTRAKLSNGKVARILTIFYSYPAHAWQGSEYENYAIFPTNDYLAHFASVTGADYIDLLRVKHESKLLLLKQTFDKRYTRTVKQLSAEIEHARATYDKQAIVPTHMRTSAHNARYARAAKPK